jgi:hypothetical protein
MRDLRVVVPLEMKDGKDEKYNQTDVKYYLFFALDAKTAISFKLLNGSSIKIL